MPAVKARAARTKAPAKKRAPTRKSARPASKSTRTSRALVAALRSAVERRAGTPGMKTASGAIVPELPLWAQLIRIGGSLTPEQVSGFIREADNGYMAPLMDLANEARQKDGHLQSILATSEEAISGLDWELVLPEDAKLKEKKAAEWFEERLRATPSFQRFLAHHAGAAFYGYAVSEITWGVVDNGRIAPTSLKAIAGRRFVFALQTGALCWWDPVGAMAYPGVDIRAEHPNRFVISQPRINGDVPCREGLVRVLMWAALFRNWALSDWLKLAEIAWKPWRTGKYKKTLQDDSEAAALLALLEIMSSTGVAVVPDTATVTVEWPKAGGSTSNHHELLSMLAGEMSKTVLGQTLTTEQTRVGSQALGNVHNEVRKDLRDSRARSVAEDVDRDLIGPMGRMNFAADIRLPTFRFLTEDPTDLVAFSLGVKQLRDAGTKIPQAWVRQEAGIPEPDDDEELLGDGDPAQAQDAAAANGAQETPPAADQAAE